MAYDKSTKSDGLQEKLISAKRHAKVTKGGRLFSFSTCVVVGDGKGHVGFSKRSGREIATAMPKALEKARQGMLYIETTNGTVHHRVEATYGATKVIILPGVGTGIKAGRTMRAIFKVLGFKNIVGKIIGSRNHNTVIRATLKALKQVNTPEALAEKRGKVFEKEGVQHA